MEKLSMCRVCLTENIRLKSIIESHLQEIYETLVMVPFETKDIRPILVCYLCCAKLQNCYDLKRSCLQSEEVLKQMMSCDELKPLRIRENNRKRLTEEHNVVYYSIDREQTETEESKVKTVTYVDIKVERSDLEDNSEDSLEMNPDPLVTVKVERCKDLTNEPSPMYSHQQFTKYKQNSTNEITPTSVTHSKSVKCTCDTCQQCYTSKCTLKTHTSKNNATPYQCDVSEKFLPGTNNAKQPMVIHTDDNIHRCEICNKPFSHMSVLTVHMRTHTGEKPYRCDICQKQFSEKGHLTVHARTHTGEKPFCCDVCQKRFSQKQNLTSHMLTHSGEKPFSCSVCDMHFLRKYDVTGHMRVHTGEKPFTCKVCKQSFAKSGYLTQHMRKHTGEKPFCCNVCKKQFAKKSDLNVHMRSHTGEKPYHCDICNKLFSHRSTLNAHTRRQNCEKPDQ